MATIIYYTGNGYRCSCCRQSSKDYLNFDDVEDAIVECIDIASGSEWDFGIDTIQGYEGDAYELEQQIMDAVSQAEDDQETRRKIEQIKKDIAHTENWFDTLEETKVKKAEFLATKRQELEDLTK